MSRTLNKLDGLWPPFRLRVVEVLEELSRLKWEPMIVDGWRDPVAQLAAYRAGNSKLKWGLHCVTGKNGRRESLAADIVDGRYQWAGPVAFWLDLCRVAREKGLVSGAEWGLSKTQRVTLAAKAEEAAKSNGAVKVALGWDPAHCQCVKTTVPVALIRAGWRPKLK